GGLINGNIGNGGVTVAGNPGNGKQATLTVNGAVTTAANFNVAAAANVNVTGNNSYTEYAATTTVTGALTAANIAVVGGTLDGTGTLTGHVDVSGGTILAGTPSVPGTLSLHGNYVEESGGILAADISGTSANQVSALAVSGGANLQGG